jgi:hypothetical protein
MPTTRNVGIYKGGFMTKIQIQECLLDILSVIPIHPHSMMAQGIKETALKKYDWEHSIHYLSSSTWSRMLKRLCDVGCVVRVGNSRYSRLIQGRAR